MRLSLYPLYFQLLDVVIREETLHNVIRSVTGNWQSIVLTMFFALVLVYLFSIAGFLYLKDDFVIEVTPKHGKILDSCQLGLHQFKTCQYYWS